MKSSKNRWNTAIGHRKQDFVLMTLLGHPTISGYAFSFFSCVFIEEPQGTFYGNSTVNKTGSYYMTRDYSLKCYDTQWWLVAVLAMAVIILFSLGAPAMFAFNLWRNRETLDDPETEKQLGVLYMPYRRGVYWYEPLQMVFKLGLWVALCFFADGSQLQLVTALAITIVQLTVHARLLPYSSDAKNFLQTIGLILTAAVAFSGMTLNYLLVAKREAFSRFDSERETSLQFEIDVFEVLSQVVVFGGIVVVAVAMAPKVVRFWIPIIVFVGKKIKCRCRKLERYWEAQKAAYKAKLAKDEAERKEKKARDTSGRSGTSANNAGGSGGGSERSARALYGSTVNEGKTNAGISATARGGKLGRGRNARALRLAEAKKKASGEERENPMHKKRSVIEMTAPDLDSPWHSNGEVVVNQRNPMHTKRSSIELTAPDLDSPWHGGRDASTIGTSTDGVGGVGGISGVGGVGGGGDDGINEGVESTRPDLMVLRDDNRQNRTGSVEINDDGGGDGDGDGEGGGDDDAGDDGGAVNEGAETNGADLTIALDDDNRREERVNSFHV